MIDEKAIEQACYAWLSHCERIKKMTNLMMPIPNIVTLDLRRGISEVIEAYLTARQLEPVAVGGDVVERVARALCRYHRHSPENVAWPMHVDEAKAAIAAMQPHPGIEQTQQSAEAFPMGAIENGRVFMRQLENGYDDFNSMHENWVGLKQCFEYMADYLIRAYGGTNDD